MDTIFSAPLACDYYKIGHATKMQPSSVERVATTWTARSNKHHPGCQDTVVFGYQYTIAQLKRYFDEAFFSVPIEDLKRDFEDMIALSFHPDYADFSKFEALHELGYLPLAIYGVPEGTLLPVGIPSHMIFNTDGDFAWLPQFIEDLWSANNWLPSTSATTAYYRRKLLWPFVEKTCDDPKTAIQHMCGNFCLRGHTSLEAGYISGLAHGLSFDRTATIHSNTIAKNFYGADKPVMLGTPSLEHSVVEQGIAVWRNRIINNDVPDLQRNYLNRIIADNWEMNLMAEMCFIIELLANIQPTGVMTYVADTYDYWGVVAKILPTIKDLILGRNGCFSVRPDSGNPVDIICGDRYADDRESPEALGTLVCLMKTFGAEPNSKGCLELPPQIRMIYGDAITAEISKTVGEWCVDNMVAMNNLCFGIGAYTYQYVTRDTRGFAIKATYCDDEKYGGMQLYKQPKTDPGKKSPRGAVAVVKTNDASRYKMIDHLSLNEAIERTDNVMVCLFKNGDLYNQENFETIKKRLWAEEGV